MGHAAREEGQRPAQRQYPPSWPISLDRRSPDLGRPSSFASLSHQWQQSLGSSSTTPFPSVASPTTNRRSSPNARSLRAPLPAGLGPHMNASAHRHTASLTWQQALLPPHPNTGASANSAPSTVRRRNSVSMSGGSSSRMEDATTKAQRQQSMMVATPMATPTKTTAIMPKEDVAPGRAGPRYAGPMFHNSPMANDLPKPRFGGRM